MLLPILFALACTTTKDPGDDGGTPSTEIPQEGHDSDEPTVDVDERAANLSSGSGDFATDYLVGAPYDKLEVEVDYVAGRAPDAGALETLRQTLEEICNKPGGVTIVVDDEIPDQGAPGWTTQAAEDMEIAWRDRYRDAERGVAVMYFLYLDGNSASDSESGRILGFAYHGSSLVMFADTMEDVSLGLLGLGEVEPTVLLHEAGHVLGLVNNGVGMVDDHEDPEHNHHDVSDGCLMYWAAETDAIGEILGSGTPEFDAACRADLKAAGGR